MGISFKKMNQKEIHSNSLEFFVRDQQTNRVKVFENGSLIEKDVTFEDVWDDAKKQDVCKYLQSVDGTVIFVYDDEKVIGFTNIDHTLFDGYMNMPYCHISKDYRGLKLGQQMFYNICKEAYLQGADKLYLSGHPAVETQGFYASVGCVLADKINEELLAIEPYDIQLEKSLYGFKMEDIIRSEFEQLGRVTATTISKVANKTYKFVKNRRDYKDVIVHLMNLEEYGFFSVATLYIKKNKEFINKDNIEFFEKLLNKSVQGWAQVDQFCYRGLNPMIELDDQFYEYLLKWSKSENKDVRRASLVSMIRSSQKQTLEYDYDKMIHLVDRLKHDEDFHVRKGVGWTLKVAFPTYPDKVEQYLRDNVKNLDRMIFRYALEHVPNPLRKELLELEYRS